MTETEVSGQLLGGCYNTLPNKVLNRVLDDNLRTFAGSISFDERELAFAAALQQTLPEAQVAVAPGEPRRNYGSGSGSRLNPTVLL